MKKVWFWPFVGLVFHLMLSPASAESLQLKIGKLFAQGRTTEIEPILTDALEQTPGNYNLWLELADLRKSQGDYPGAVAAYQSYLAHQEDWKVRVSLALLLEEMGSFTNAGQNLLQLHQDHPQDEEILWGLARLCLYQSKWKSIRTQASAPAALHDAQKYLLTLSKLKPELALYTWELAEVSRALGDRETALRAYEKVVREDASYKLAHRYMARLLAQKGLYREALAKYEQAMAVEPDDEKLKKEARQAGLKAPQEAAWRRDERMKEWKKWAPPEEKPLAASSVTIRVGLFTGIQRLLLRGTSDLKVVAPLLKGTPLPGPAPAPLAVLSAYQDYQVLYTPAGKSKTKRESWVIADMKDKVLLAFDEAVWIEPKDSNKPIVLHAVPSNTGYFFAKEEDRAYRDNLEILPKAKTGFGVISLVSLEDYTAGVLPSEMPSSWPMEALKTQAVLARTYVLSKMTRHSAEGFDVCDSVHCQVYRGLRAETDRTNQAVNETAGIVLKHSGKILPVAFSAQCGGHTQDYAEAWGGKQPVPGVADYEPRFNQDMEFPLSPFRLERWIREDRTAYCRVYGLRGYQNYRWAWVVSAKAIEKKAGNIGKVRRLIVTHRSSAGWADRLLAEGDQGSRELKGDSIRSFLGGTRSNLIWIESQFNPKGWPEEFMIYGGGWGHGVGMCQVGSYGLAKAGKTWEEIVTHYFPKADIEKL